MGEAEPQFPLGMCIAAIVWTWLGVAAAAFNIRWGADMAQGDGTSVAWVYCNVMLTLLWLVVWPALRRRREKQLTMEAMALVAGALPACWVSAVVAGPSSGTIGACLLLQAALGIFAGGLIAAGRVTAQ